MNIIQYLITELGCDPTTPDQLWQLSHYTLLVSNGHLDATIYFITDQNCDSNIRDQYESTPLNYASKGGHMNIIRYLITELGCDPTTPINNGVLPVHIACFNGHLNAIEYFVTIENFDPNSLGQHGWIFM